MDQYWLNVLNAQKAASLEEIRAAQAEGERKSITTETYTFTVYSHQGKDYVTEIQINAGR